MSVSPLISIIVPVYNTEQYLCTCLDSLFKQGLNERDYEVILVNDGSTDKSFEICKEYKEQHQNIVLLSQPNQGVSSARNYGLSQAKGEWVCFVDSDDYMVGNSLCFLFNNYVRDCYDVIRYWTKIVVDDTINHNDTCSGEILYTGTGFQFIKEHGLDSSCYIYLIRRLFLQENQLSFKPYRLGEDFLFASMLLLSNPRICSTSCNVYLYLIHPNTATTNRTKNHARKVALDHLNLNKEFYAFLKRNNFIDREVYRKCLEALQMKMPMVFSRLLCSDINQLEFEGIAEAQKAIDTLPVNYKNGGVKWAISQLFINGLVRFPILFIPTKFLFSHIFVPYILPLLDRNK